MICALVYTFTFHGSQKEKLGCASTTTMTTMTRCVSFVPEYTFRENHWSVFRHRKNSLVCSFARARVSPWNSSIHRQLNIESLTISGISHKKRSERPYTRLALSTSLYTGLYLERRSISRRIERSALELAREKPSRKVRLFFSLYLSLSLFLSLRPLCRRLRSRARRYLSSFQ